MKTTYFDLFYTIIINLSDERGENSGLNYFILSFSPM